MSDLGFIYFYQDKEIHLSLTNQYLLTKEEKVFPFNKQGLDDLSTYIRNNDAIYLGYNLQYFLAKSLESFSYAFYFSYFDILRLFRAFYGIKEEPSLDDLSYDYAISLDKFNPAKSMFVFLLEDSGYNYDYFLLGSYSDCKLNAKRSGAYEYFKIKQEKETLEAVEKLTKGEIKGVFVFDFECANNDRGIGKICELGGLYLDSNLNLIKEVEYLFNPEGEFRLGSDIKLYYPYSKYMSSPTISYLYKEFASLFEDPSILKVGYASKNDVSFLVTDLIRYNKIPPSFICFDLQPLVDIELNSKQDISLGNANISLLGDLGSNTEHRSLDDSKLTLRLLKYFLKEDSLKEFILKNKDYFTSSYYLKELRENRLVEVAYW